MRPDRIVVGEVRSDEALDMLQAMNTGHDGSLTTVHANTPRDALARIETMIAMGATNLPERAMRQQIASAIQLVVQQTRLSDGSRKVTSVSEITGMEGDVITMQEIFVFEKLGVTQDGKVIGRFRATGVRPKCGERLRASGIHLPTEMFEGVMDATMSHNEAWHWGRIGRFLERADKTTRILDMKYFILLPDVTYVGTALDNIQWSALLRSASALEMYLSLGFIVAPQTIAYNNGMTDSGALQVGQSLVVPPFDAAVQMLGRGETIETIAARFAADADTLRALNGLGADGLSDEPRLVLVPVPDARYPGFRLRLSEPPRVLAPRMRWPTDGVITQLYAGGHTGVDIAAPYGSPVVASDAGTVTSGAINIPLFGDALALRAGTGYEERLGFPGPGRSLRAGLRLRLGRR